MCADHSTGITVVTLALALLAPVTAKAQIANDQENYYGDRLRVSVDVEAKLRDDPSPTPTVCIPDGTTMVVIGQSEKSLVVKLEGDPKDCKNANRLSSAIAYEVDMDKLKKSGSTRTGITYGALVIPFKYQTTGDKDFTGSASLGGYFGYRFETLRRIGVTAVPIVFMGASNISVQNDSTSSSQNVMGFSYGCGLVGTFKSAFQAGVVVGEDRVGKSVDYPYNGKLWIALEIGFAFLQ